MYVSVTQDNLPERHPLGFITPLEPGNMVPRVILSVIFDVTIRIDVYERSNMRWNRIECGDSVGIVVYAEANSKVIQKTSVLTGPNVFSFEVTIRSGNRILVDGEAVWASDL